MFTEVGKRNKDDSEDNKRSNHNNDESNNLLPESIHVIWNTDSISVLKVKNPNVNKGIYHSTRRKNLRVEVVKDLLDTKFNSNLKLSNFQN